MVQAWQVAIHKGDKDEYSKENDTGYVTTSVQYGIVIFSRLLLCHRESAVSIYYCETRARETNEFNYFICVAQDEDELKKYFEDEYTELLGWTTDVEGEICRQYDGLVLLSSI